VLGQVLAEFPGKVRLVYKDYPLNSHAGAEPAARAARCAGEHSRFWEYHDLLFTSPPAFSRGDLLTYAARLGLPQEAFTACLDGGRFRDAVQADLQEGRAAGVSGTPTFFVNGKKLVGAQPLQAFRLALQDALNETNGKRP
jgi:protein-disulfide isomerase